MIIDLEIVDITPKGFGVAKKDGLVYFVKGPVTIGDKVRANVVRQRRSVVEAYSESLLEASPYREVPRCPHFGTCGGCQLQNLRYEAQLQWKGEFVKQALLRIGKVQVDQVGVAPCAVPYHYRTKAHFALGQTNDGVALGYFDTTDRWFPLVQCPILKPRALEVAQQVTQVLRQNNLTGHFGQQAGTLRHLQVRVSMATGETQVLLTFNEQPQKLSNLAEQLLRSGIQNVAFHLNQSKSRVVLSSDKIWIYGKDHINEQLLGKKYILSPVPFFQVNPPMAEKLFATALQYLEPDPQDVVFEGYGGVGSVTMLYANQVRQVYMAEANRAAITDAKRNARSNDIINVLFVEATTENALKHVLKCDIKVDKVIVDPPRAGLSGQTIQGILSLGPERVVYVSCDPATLARDLLAFTRNGYTLSALSAFDMFPQTSHVECVVLLKKSEP